MSTYLVPALPEPRIAEIHRWHAVDGHNDKDHLCTQVSYRLNLRGPSVAVQTTCSTSLVAVALACESLQAWPLRHGAGRRRDGAGAAAGGYYYTAGSILSPDGHCRPFDANAPGHHRRQRRRASWC